MKPMRTHNRSKQQRGAALMVMLVVLIIGFTTYLVSALSQISLKNERISRTSDALSQAKDALIGRAATAPNVPGSLPCPDINNDGSSEGIAGNCTSYIGRLPWKTLGLPDLRDSTGERLWYALSINFRDNSAAHINSDTLGTITVFAPDGTLLNDGSCSTYNGSCKPGAVAVIIAPGEVLNRQGGGQQDRSTSGLNNAINYLDIATINGNTNDNGVFTGSSTSTTGFIQGIVKIDGSGNITNDRNGTVIVNDQILTITRDQLLPVVEMRIAREVRNCLETYALNSANNIYPWAAPVSPYTYTASQNTLFGRIPATPDTSVTTMTTTYNTSYVPINSSNDPNYNAVNNALNSLQNAVTNCTTSDGGTNPTNLNNASDYLLKLLASLTNPPYTTSFINSAINAANTGIANSACQNIENNSNYNSIQTNLNSAKTKLQNLTVAITTSTITPVTVQVGPTSWYDGCFDPASMKYWNDWSSFVFYQIDDRYKPNGTLGVPSISINSQGNYRAAVLLARRPIGNEVRNTSDVTSYLEGINPHSAVNPATSFEVHQLLDNPTTNDLVLCLDGKTSASCK